MQELSHDQVGDLVVDRRTEKDDPLVQQTAVDVERALSARGLLDNHGYEWAHRPRFFRFLGRIPAECSNRLTPARTVPGWPMASAAGSPDLPSPSFFLIWRPQLLARLRLLDGDWLGLPDE